MKHFLIPILAVALCGLLLAAVLTLPDSETPAVPNAPQSSSDSTSAPAVEPLTFPYEPEQNRILLNSPFSYDGMNPDCDYADGKNIAAITVKNHSGQHLVQADLTLVAAGGIEIPFRIEHLPTDRAITAFALDNAPLPAEAEWIEVRISTQYAQQHTLCGNGVDITEHGMLIDVTNNTGAELTNLKINCHNLLGEEYFGGKSYPYEINNLPDGETVTVEALDCVLGIAEVAYTEGN